VAFQEIGKNPDAMAPYMGKAIHATEKMDGSQIH